MCICLDAFIIIITKGFLFVYVNIAFEFIMTS